MCYHDILSSKTGRGRKSPCLISGELSRDLDALDENQVFSLVVDSLIKSRRRLVGFGSGPYALFYFAHMAFGCCLRLGEMLADEICGEARPCGKSAGLDGCNPSGFNRTEGSLVKILCQLGKRRLSIRVIHDVLRREDRGAGRKWN